MSPEVHRKLTTILAADAAGYSRLMEANESRTFDLLHSSFEVFSKVIDRHEGRIADTAGDGLIAEFPSVVEAVQCAVEVQQELDTPPEDKGEPLRFRIGIHLGDVMVHGKDLVGEGVNLAARLQSMAEPGGILISRQVYDQVHSKLSIGFDYLGERRPKNFSEDVLVYRVSSGRQAGLFDAWRNPFPKTPPRPAPPEASPRPHMNPGVAARLTGIVVAGLLVIDVATGAPFWTHWPALALATILALSAVPQVVGRRDRVAFARLGVLILALVLVNLFSWSGYFWALWPAGALFALLLGWRALFSRS